MSIDTHTLTDVFKIGQTGGMPPESPSSGLIEYGNDPVFALGIDVGSTSTKSAIVRIDGGRARVIAVAVLPTGVDSGSLVAGALESARQVVERAGIDRIDAIGVASMAETGAVVPLDGEARPLVRWNRDRDAAGGPSFAELDSQEIFRRTGVPLVSKTPLAVWRSLAEADPAWLGRGERWGFAADLVAHAMTGELRTDHTIAGRTGALPIDTGDIVPTSWDDELLGLAHIAKGQLPLVAGPDDRPLPVRHSPVHAVARGAPVVVAGHDHAVAAWIAGARHPGVIVHSLGTSEAALSALDVDPDRFSLAETGMSLTRTVDGDRLSLLAGSPTAGELITEWRERFASLGHDVESVLGAGWRDEVLPAAIVLPYGRGRQCPNPDPDARRILVGTAGGPRTELLALLAGLAAHGRWMRTELQQHGARAERLALVGEPARRNPVWAGLIAALAEHPVTLLDTPAPVAAGAAVLAAVRSGLADPLVSLPYRMVDPLDIDATALIDRFTAALDAGSRPHDRPTTGAS